MTHNITIVGDTTAIYSKTINISYTSAFGVKIQVISSKIIPSISMDRKAIDEFYDKNPPDVKEIELSKEDSVKLMIALQKINF